MRRLLLALGFLLLLITPGGAAGAADAAAPVGFDWPLAGAHVVDRGFTPPTSAYGAGHRGVDLRAELDQSVLAAGPGQVSYAGLLAGRGVVTVTHPGGLRTTYEPLDPAVHVGQAVAVGAVLGRLTSGHASCLLGTYCLHWGLLRGGTYLDPLTLVERSRVRLLPLAAGQEGRLPPPDRPASQNLPPTPPTLAAKDVSTSALGSSTATAGLVAFGGLAAGLLTIARRSRT